MALLIEANGSEQTIHPQNKKRFSLEELQKFVGGYIERVPTQEPKDFLVNEEGLLKRLPMNGKASTLVGQMVVGPLVVFEGKERLK